MTTSKGLVKVKALKCLNEFGNVDLSTPEKRQAIAGEYQHVCGKRLQLICRKLNIPFAEAIVGWNEYRPTKYAPVIDGVVVPVELATLLEEAIAARDRKANDRRNQQVGATSVLLALCTLNRRAKRCRELATTYYSNCMHGLAKACRLEKVSIYELKEQALHYLVEDGVLSLSGHHMFADGNWAELLEGNGFRFHRPCPPLANAAPDLVLRTIEAKPKGKDEPPLKVAREVLERYLEDKPTVSVFRWPSRR